MRRTAVLIIAACAFLPACSPSSRPCPATPAEAMFGCAPDPNNDGVTYQPDVVFVSGGADSLRSWSPDGLTWIIKGDAGGVDQLAPGKIMFVTGIVVGRVLAIKPVGGDRAVTLAPAGLTDVIKDGDIASTQPIAFDDPQAYVTPMLPGMSLDASTASTRATSAARQAAPPPIELLDEPSQPEVTLGPGTVFETLCCRTKLGAFFRYDEGGLIVGGAMWYAMSSPSVTFDLHFYNGALRAGQLTIHGLRGLHVEFAAASQSGAAGNIWRLFAIPVDFTVPVRKSGGYVGQRPPLTFTVTQYWVIKTVFTARDSTLEARADYSFPHDLSVDVVPNAVAAHEIGIVKGPLAFTAKTKLLDTVTGLSVGVAGLVLAYNAEFRFGFGGLVGDGLYYGLTSTIGVANDSSAVALLAGRCRGASFKLNVRGGLGHYLAGAFAEALGLEPVAGETRSVDAWAVSQTLPNSPEYTRCVPK
jgi:hypothetical protein